MAIFGNGSNLILCDTSDEPILAQKGLNIELNADMIDISTKLSDGFKDVLPGKRSFAFNVDGLVSMQGAFTISDMLTYFGNRTQFTIYIEKADVGVYFEGDCYVSNVALNAGTEDAPTYSASIEGTGEFINNII